MHEVCDAKIGDLAFIRPMRSNFFIFATISFALKLKKALVYSILFVFLFNSAGYYFLFEVKKFMAGKEMQSIMKRHQDKLTVLTFADVAGDKEFQRIHKKEFRFKGEMYDIVREIKTAHKTVFICLHDAKESKLITGLKKMNQHKLHLVLWEQFTMIFLRLPSIELNPVYTGSLTFPRIEVSLSSSVLPTWSPPPECS